jgi:hypothetical protein
VNDQRLSASASWGEVARASLLVCAALHAPLQGEVSPSFDLQIESGSSPLEQTPVEFVIPSACYMKENKCTIFEANKKLTILEDETLNKYMQSGFLLQKGFTLNDI